MASIVDTSVKHAYSSMAGAPVINGTAGSLISALKAFLVTGWGAKVVDSAVISNGVCRLTFASGKSAAEVHSVITLSGASPSALNGEQRVTAVAAGWVEFKTNLPDGSVTGSLSFKMSSLGWEEIFSKTNVSVFRATDPRGTRAYFRFDDSNATYARVQMYESMTDVDTGVGVAPALSGGYYISKRQSAGTDGTYWLLIGDAQGFYFSCAPDNGSTTTSVQAGITTRYFGDINSYRSGDAWCAMVTGGSTASVSLTEGCMFQNSTQGSRMLMRGYHGIGASVSVDRLAFGSSSVSGATATLGAFPSKTDNGLRLCPLLFMEGSNGPRGEAPGLLFCPQDGAATAFKPEVGTVAGSGQLAGKTLLSIGVGTPNTAIVGIGFFNITDPWRAQ